MSSLCWIVIVNYRTARLAINSLLSISTELPALQGCHVLVIDNDSRDGSIDEIESAIRDYEWGGWARVIASGGNQGFAYGNNVGIRNLLSATPLPDYVLLLNPDTVVRHGAVYQLLEFMNSHPSVGIAGSLLENYNGGLDCSAHRFHSPLSELDAGTRLGILTYILGNYVVSAPPRLDHHSCDWVSGASMMIRREVIDDIGLMDENYFLYFEEVDYCRRAKAAGWEVWSVPDSRVLHLEGAATGISKAAVRRPSYWYESRRRYFTKHHGIATLLLADLLWAIGRISYQVRRLLHLGARGENSDPKWFMFDLLWGDLKALFSGQLLKIRRQYR